MPTPTYTALANVTLGSMGPVSFTNIPQSYKSLVIVVSGFTTARQLNLRFNDASSDYSMVTALGNGTSGVSNKFTSQNNISAVPNANISGRYLTTWNIFDYSLTDRHTSVIFRTGSTNLTSSTLATWNSTTAVNKISFYNTDLEAGTTFALYGIAG